MRLEQLYARLPVALQHAATTVQGARYHLQRYGGVFSENLNALRSLEFASADELEALSLLRMHKMLRHAFENVPYYRDVARRLGCSWQDFVTLRDLRRLPPTSKADVRRNPAAFVACNANRAKLIPWYTSGTTGSPLELFYSPQAVQRLYAFVELYREQAGVSRFLRRGQFTGKLIVPPRANGKQNTFWRFDLANRSLLLSTMHLHAANLRSYADAIVRFRPAYIAGYPSSIYILAQYYRGSGREAPPCGLYSHRLKRFSRTSER
jgi:phenylacetate-CoA ligase